jgi:MFS family permease
MTMVGTVDMSKDSLEREVYRGRFDDGLLDLCVGVGLLGIGLAWLAGHVALTGVFPALMIPVWLVLRKRITEPRVGRVEFSKERRRAERRGLSQALGAGIGVFVLALAAAAWIRGGASAPGGWAPLIPSLLVGLALVIVSALIGAWRFAAYSVTLVALAGLVTWLGGEPGTYLALAGGLLSLWAGGLVARFTATHPDLERE